MKGNGALIFLHGSGGSGNEISSYLESLSLPSYRHETFGDILRTWNIQLYTPTAKERRYTPCYGDRMNVWYDRSARFEEEGLATAEDTAGVDQSIAFLRSYIQDIEQRKPFDFLILGGFSMGGGLALHSYRQEIHPKLKAVFCIGSWASDPSALYRDRLSSHRNVPLFMLHGESDSLIYCDWGRKTCAGLLIRDINVMFQSYPNLDHEISSEELGDLLDWIRDFRQSALTAEQRADEQNTRLEAKYDALEKESVRQTADAPVGQRACRVPVPATTAETIAAAEAKKATSSSGTASAKAEDKDENAGYTCIAECLPFKVEASAAAVSATTTTVNKTYPLREVIVKFRLESEYVPLLLSRPVLACGSMFDILDDRPHGVKVRVTSPDIEKTAYEIGRRLFIRLRSESQSLNPCSPS